MSGHTLIRASLNSLILCVSSPEGVHRSDWGLFACSTDFLSLWFCKRRAGGDPLILLSFRLVLVQQAQGFL